MGDFQKPIQRFEDDKSKEWMLPPPERIEKGKQDKEEISPSNREEEMRSLLFATLAFFCKKFLSLFSSEEKIQAALIDLKQITQDLSQFKDLLQQLRREDISRNPIFTRQFSEVWQRLHEDLKNIISFERTNPVLSTKLKNILTRIATYPPFVDHPLGYYLTEHVGEEWLPVPFMDILSHLHKEHQNQLEKSELSAWTAALSDLLSSLDIRPSLI